MTMLPRRLLIAMTVLAMSAMPALPALAQSGKPTRMVVAFPPGGPVDIVARILAEPMGKSLGTSVIVDNKAGGNTFIAAENVARSAADGSTVFLTTPLTMAINPLLYDKLPYDPETDFAPISLVISTPTILVVHPSNPAADAIQFAAASKAAAQPVAVGSAGVGGSTHIALELFAQASGARTLHVPYKGAAPVISDLVNNQIGAFFGDLPGIVGHVRGGKLKALAVLAKTPNARLPGIKTMAEQGFPGVEFENWYALYAPAKTPADAIQRLHKAAHAALAEDAVKAKLADIGAVLIPSSPEELARVRRADGERIGALIKAKGIKAE